MLSYKFSTTLPWNKKLLTAQGDFGKIIAVARSKLCRLRMYLGNVDLDMFGVVVPKHMDGKALAVGDEQDEVGDAD